MISLSIKVICSKPLRTSSWAAIWPNALVPTTATFLRLIFFRLFFR